ncbi:MAG: co-chaperone DjlA, partial [Gammaproteobacteria bacterium]
MSWWGKILGGTFGFMLGGPLGALMGASFGHNFDRGLGRVASGQFESGDQERVQAAFFTAVFSIMGHLAKADGQVTRDEIQMARDVMTRMSLNEQMRTTAINLFNEGRQADFPFDEVISQFRQECHRRKHLMQMFMEILLHAAYADGHVHPQERNLLNRIREHLGF